MPAPALVTAMACATVSTDRPERLVGIVRDHLGWESRAEGAITPELERLWGIAPGSAGDRFTLLGSPGSQRGLIRVVRGRERWPARQLGARWSGIEFIVMMDVDALRARLDADPDFAARPPKTVDYTSGGANIHRYFMARGPGGTHMLFTMKITEARDHTFPSAPADVGYVFSLHLTSGDYAGARGFYSGVLGMTPVFEAHIVAGSWQQTWGLPPETPVDVAILKGDAPDFGLGGIELQGYPPAFVDPIAPARDRFDGGACLGTFTTRDIDAAYDAVRGATGVTVLSAPTPIADAPYAGARAFAALAPGGERLEICERFI